MNEKHIEKIVKDKLTEHIYETEAVQQELDNIREKMSKKKDVELAQKLMILKDKMMFHKACTMVLQDVLDTLNEKA